MLRHALALLLPLVTMTLGACATNPVVRLYEGESRTTAEVLRVQVPMELKVLTINDRRIESLGGVFSWGQRELHLEPGTYRFIAHYKELFELDADQHDVVKSDPVIFEVTGEAGEVFRLGFKEPGDVNDARELAQQFSGWSENLATGERTPTRPSGMISAGGFLGLVDAAQPVAASETVAPAEHFGADDTSAPAPVDVTSPDTAPTEAQTAPDDVPSSTITLEQMKTLWKDATQAERQQFLLWLAE